MNNLMAVFKLTRFEHSIMLIIAVIAAELIVGGLPTLQILLLSLVTPVFISASAFAINDYFDVKTDRANRRTERPIVSGDISRDEAMWIAITCLLIGVIASALINLNAFLIGVIFGALAFFYSYKLKDVVLAGNAYVALSMAIPFIFGNYVVSNVLNPSIAIIVVIVFSAGLAREIHGMIRDRKGDKERNTRNLLHYFSDDKAALIALVLYVESVLLSIVLFLYKYPFLMNTVYLIPVFVADVAMLYVAVNFIWKKDREFYDLARNLSLGAMTLVLIAYLACAIWFIPV